MRIAHFLLTLLVLLLSCGQVFAKDRVMYFHNDALGSPVAATDETGTVVWREDYAPYGERLLKEDGGEEALWVGSNQLWYTGKEEEEDLGLQYYGARWYDPSIGRFLSLDPAGFDEGNIHSFNKYAYANNNPYRYVDPDGNSPVSALIQSVVYYTGVGYALGVGADMISQYAAFGDASFSIALSSNAALAGGEAGFLSGLGVGAAKYKTAKQVLDATKSGGQTFERVVSNAELKATQQTGLLRGGREGENFFTNSASLDAKRAQQRLGLDGPLRDARIQFRIKNNVEVTGPRSAAPGRTGTAGGGREFSTNGRTEIEKLRVDPLRK